MTLLHIQYGHFFRLSVLTIFIRECIRRQALAVSADMFCLINIRHRASTIDHAQRNRRRVQNCYVLTQLVGP